MKKGLQEHAEMNLPLGHILVSRGYIDEETLAEAIAFQSDLSRAEIRIASSLPAAVSLDMCVRLGAMPIGQDANGRPIIAVGKPLAADALRELASAFGAQPVQHIARDSEILSGLRLATAEMNAKAIKTERKGMSLLGELLVQNGKITRETLEQAMQHYVSQQHGRIGDYLVSRGLVSREVIEETVQQQMALLRLALGVA
jgi:adsorption protein B